MWNRTESVQYHSHGSLRMFFHLCLFVFTWKLKVKKSAMVKTMIVDCCIFWWDTDINGRNRERSSWNQKNNNKEYVMTVMCAEDDDADASFIQSIHIVSHECSPEKAERVRRSRTILQLQFFLKNTSLKWKLRKCLLQSAKNSTNSNHTSTGKVLHNQPTHPTTRQLRKWFGNESEQIINKLSFRDSKNCSAHQKLHRWIFLTAEWTKKI